MTRRDDTMVWTDFGGVLVPDASGSLPAFAAEVGVHPTALLWAMREVAASHGTSDILEPIDTPMLPETEWLAQVGDVLGRSLPAEALTGEWFVSRPVDHQWLETLWQLRDDGVSVGLLSNMPPAWAGAWPDLVDPALFDAVVISSAVGARKPNQDLFHLAATRTGRTAAQCILVDDLALNCEGARAAGWQAIHFRNALDASVEIKALTGTSRER